MLSFKKKLKIFASLAAVAALFVFLNAFSGHSAVKNILLAITSPFSRAALASSDFLFSTFKTITEIKNLSIENADLKSENRNLLAELARYKELAKEAEELRAQLGVTAGEKERFLLSAEIINYDPVSLSYSLVINRGIKDGVAEGSPVIMAGNILLGKISGVYGDFSSVLLIADKNNKVGARLERAETSGVVGGSACSSLLMDLIDKNGGIGAGDLILTSGLDGIYPRGLVIGRVAKISENAEGIFKQAFVTASYSGFKSTRVFVILKQETPEKVF